MAKKDSSALSSSAPASPTKISVDSILRDNNDTSISSRIDPSLSSILPPHIHSPSPSSLRAAEEIKRKLVERLLKIDARLLKEVMANIPSSPMPPLVNLTPTLEYSSMRYWDSNHKTKSAFFIDENDGEGERIISYRSSSVPPQRSYPPESSQPISSSFTKKTTPSNSKFSSSNSTVPPIMMPPPSPHKFKLPKPKNYVRASPHENELMEGVLRIKSSSNTILNRLRRKLIVRRMKRRAGIDIFDIDITMYHYLKSNNPLRYPDSSKSDGIAIKIDHHKLEDDKIEMENKKEITRMNILTEEEELSIPYIKNPSLSFMAKIRGLSNLEEYFPLYKYPPEQISSFTGQRLPSFIERNTDICPPKLALLREIEIFWAIRKDNYVINNANNTIDFVHILKDHIPLVNRFLRSHFWPSIDMVEYLDYPDFGIVIMFKKMIIGCGFITPDAYITYMLIHPEWRGSSLGKRLLYLLLSRPSIRVQDVTLHVGIDNPAMILYQGFGFKSEEFIVNFYEKYYNTNETSASKHAVFMRLRR